MNNVTINGKDIKIIGETPVKLNNGSLVIHYSRSEVIGAYIVTSYRGLNQQGGTSQYCSFIDLDTGYIKFEERCSRTTTVGRVLSHLNHNDYRGKNALECGQNIEVYNLGNYKIDLKF